MNSPSDPYRTPDADVNVVRTDGMKLFKPGHVALATVFGTPMAGFWLIGANQQAIGEHDTRRKTLLMGFVITVVLLAISYFMPEGFPSLGINIVVIIGMYQYAKGLQGDLVNAHLADGGAAQSAWLAFGISLLFFLGLVILLFGVIFTIGMLMPGTIF